jgi:eukaryotic-like serine/threonine-protein kinase
VEIDSLLNERYMKKRRLGQSGMGTLFLAHDEILNVDVAIKENQYTSTDHSIQFRQEAMILARLRHPNLPRVIDHFVVEGQAEHLVMDYIEGVDLAEQLANQGRPFSVEEAVQVGVVVLDALAYLHSRQPPIIHRDIKPANLKRTPEGRIMLLDFGLAKHYQGGEVTAIGAKGVTNGYSPVEQYGEGTDARSDIYALGATLFTLLTGKVPPDSVERAIALDDLDPLSDFNPEISPEVQRVIDKAMAIKAEDRFQTAAEFQNALLRACPLNQFTDRTPHTGSISAATEPRQAISPDAPTMLAPRARKRRTWVWLLPLLLVVLAGALTGLFFLWNNGWIDRLSAQEPNQTPVPLLVLENFTPTETAPESTPTESLAVMTSTPEMLPGPTLSPTPLPTAEPVGTPQGGGQGQIAFVSERDGFPQVYLMDLAGGESELEQITFEPEGACQPAWSPNGMRLAYISPCDGRREQYNGASIFVYDFDSTRTELISSLAAGDYDPAWSPDGGKLAYTSLQNGKPQIFIFDFATGETRQLMNRATINRMPVWSPDGGQIVFVTLNPLTNRPTLFIVDAEGQNEPKGILGGNQYPEAYRPDWTLEGDLIVFDLGGEGVLGGRLLGRNQDVPIQTNLSVAEGPDFSPDGKWLACDGVLDLPRHDIFLMLRTGARFQRLTEDPAEDYQVDWRPSINP